MSALPRWLAASADARGLGPLVDHTLLKPESTEADIVGLCRAAVALGCCAVCVNGEWIATAHACVAGTPVRVAGVVGFPLGASGRAAKVAEAALAVKGGASEIDMVMGLGRAKEGRWDLVRDEIAAVVEASAGGLVKVILETAMLTDAELERACISSLEAGAAFVKTSTGFHPAGGATVEAVALMRGIVGDRAGVKASGGIRTAEDARRMLLAGASRIGSSATAGWGDAVGPGALRLAELLS